MLSSESRTCIDAVLVTKVVMILSHNNSSIKRSFSINKDCLKKANVIEVTIIGSRIIYDAIQLHHGDLSLQLMQILKWFQNLVSKTYVFQFKKIFANY